MKKDKNKIDNDTCENVCPICNNYLNINSLTIEGGSCFSDYDCSKCGTTGRQEYRYDFRNHTDVITDKKKIRQLKLKTIIDRNTGNNVDIKFSIEDIKRYGLNEFFTTIQVKKTK